MQKYNANRTLLFRSLELPKGHQNDSKNTPGAASEAVHFGLLVFACPEFERRGLDKADGKPILQPYRLVNANFCWQSQLP